MSNENNSSSGTGIGGIVFSIISFWAFYYTLINPTLWGMANGITSPLDILAKVLIVVFTISGIVQTIFFTVLAIAALFGLAVLASRAVAR